MLQVLQDEGLNRYVDPQCLQREIAEASDMTPEEMNIAAREIIRRSRHIEPNFHPPDSGGGSDPPPRYSRTPPPQHEMSNRGGFSSSDSFDRNPMVKMTSVTTL